MKCWICGAEMRNTIGGNYQCENCHMAAVDDCVLRYPETDYKIYIGDTPLDEFFDGGRYSENISNRCIDQEQRGSNIQ